MLEYRGDHRLREALDERRRRFEEQQAQAAATPVDPIPREAYLFAMETMLQRHLGGPAPEVPGQRLRAYLRENLRLVGPEFKEFSSRTRPQ